MREAIRVLASFALLVATGLAHAQVPPLATAPLQIQQVSKDMAGKDHKEIRELLLARFGEPASRSGSGIQYHHWLVSGGELTHGAPFDSVTFTDQSSRVYHLPPTRSPVGKGIFSSLEMTGLPDHRGSTQWVGNLYFAKESRYRFVDAADGMPSDPAEDPSINFFVAHPNGAVEMRYVPPITAETLFESLAPGTVVAFYRFTSDSGDELRLSMKVGTYQFDTEFVSKDGLPFQLEGNWEASSEDESEFDDDEVELEVDGDA